MAFLCVALRIDNLNNNNCFTFIKKLKRMNTVSNNLQFMELITLLLPWTILSLLIPFFLAADGREIGFGLGFLACFLLSPLIGIIIILFSKDKTKNVRLNSNPIPIQTNYSKADEISKYKKLMDEGAITQLEFDKEKRNILDNI